ncbi:hypothetical protein DIPPA_70098 [Diplonema papillatum]|nr:hypothetical protein DIPPA_70098 [Diplonema papillatum]
MKRRNNVEDVCELLSGIVFDPQSTHLAKRRKAVEHEGPAEANALIIPEQATGRKRRIDLDEVIDRIASPSGSEMERESFPAKRRRRNARLVTVLADQNSDEVDLIVDSAYLRSLIRYPSTPLIRGIHPRPTYFPGIKFQDGTSVPFKVSAVPDQPNVVSLRIKKKAFQKMLDNLAMSGSICYDDPDSDKMNEDPPEPAVSSLEVVE